MQLYSYQSCDKLSCTTTTARLTIATDYQLSQTIALHALQPISARGGQAPPINRGNTGECQRIASFDS